MSSTPWKTTIAAPRRRHLLLNTSAPSDWQPNDIPKDLHESYKVTLTDLATAVIARPTITVATEPGMYLSGSSTLASTWRTPYANDADAIRAMRQSYPVAAVGVAVAEALRVRVPPIVVDALTDCEPLPAWRPP